MPAGESRALAAQPYGLTQALSSLRFPALPLRRTCAFAAPGVLAIGCLYILLSWGEVLRTQGVLSLSSPLTTVLAPQPGYLDELHVSDGEYVVEGQPLFTLLGEGWQQAEVRVAHIDAQLAALQRRAELTETTLHQDLAHLHAVYDKHQARSQAAAAAISKQQQSLNSMQALSARYQQAPPELLSPARSIDLDRNLASTVQGILALGREQMGPQDERMYTAQRARLSAQAELALNEIRGQHARLALQKEVILTDARIVVASPVAGHVDLTHLSDRALLAGDRVLSVVPTDQTPLLLVQLTPNDLNRIDRTAVANVEIHAPGERPLQVQARINNIATAPDRMSDVDVYQLQLSVEESLATSLPVGMTLRVSFSLQRQHFWSRWF